jgi:hypothetical protein
MARFGTIGLGRKGIFIERNKRGCIGFVFSYMQAEIHLWNIAIFIRWKEIKRDSLKMGGDGLYKYK